MVREMRIVGNRKVNTHINVVVKLALFLFLSVEGIFLPGCLGGEGLQNYSAIDLFFAISHYGDDGLCCKELSS
jgi:hypothetical protein